MTCREAGVVACLPPETQDGADIALLLAALADASLLTIALIAAPAGMQMWVGKQDTRRNSRVNALCTASSEGYLQPLW